MMMPTEGFSQSCSTFTKTGGRADLEGKTSAHFGSVMFRTLFRYLSDWEMYGFIDFGITNHGTSREY